MHFGHKGKRKLFDFISCIERLVVVLENFLKKFLNENSILSNTLSIGCVACPKGRGGPAYIIVIL